VPVAWPAAELADSACIWLDEFFETIIFDSSRMIRVLSLNMTCVLIICDNDDRTGGSIMYMLRGQP
jgi:hypothetical protein